MSAALDRGERRAEPKPLIRIGVIVLVFAACVPPAIAMSDLDGDGVVTREEWKNQSEQVFMELDIDKSGDLDSRELGRGFETLDENDDQRLGGGEAYWGELDTNKDAVIERKELQKSEGLSRKEFLRGRAEAFNRLDIDRSGSVTRGEAGPRGIRILHRRF